MSNRRARADGAGNPARNSTRGILKASVVLIVSSLVLQLAILPTEDNLAAASITAATSLVTFFYLFGRPSVMVRYPLSALGLLGLSVSSLSGPLVYQSVLLTPIAANLANPVRTFAYLGLVQVTLIASHVAYSQMTLLSRARSGISSKVLAPLGLFRVPGSLELLLLGYIGLGSMWLTAINISHFGDVGAKFTEGLMPLAYAPLLIPFAPYFGASRGRAVRKVWPLALYLVVLIAMGVVSNSRFTFAVGFFGLMLVVFLLYVSGALRVKTGVVLVAILCMVPALVAFGYLSDLSTAMVMVRHQRSGVTGIDLLRLTLEQFDDREAVRVYRQLNMLAEETYVANPIINRLITVNFDDNVFSYADRLSPSDREELTTITLQKIAGILPTPVIRLLGLNLNKEELAFSMGDAIHDRASGAHLGSNELGSLTGHGMILFGPFFYLVVFLVAPIIFLTVDAFTRLEGNELRYAVYALIFVFPFWTPFVGDSLVIVVGFMLRILPQTVLIYAVLSKSLSVLIPSKVTLKEASGKRISH